MAEDRHISPKLSERFSDLFGVDEQGPTLASAPDPTRRANALYMEESRKLNLNKLLHLAPYSDVLLLLGDPGVGRSTLLQAFIQRAATSWRISLVSASALMDGEALLRQIGQGLALELSEAASVDDLLWEIGRYLEVLGRSGRRAIIIIDDAHLLSDEVMLLAERIFYDERSQDSLSLVLSMRRDQGDKLTRFALLSERLAYTIRIEPLSHKEVDGYLRQHLAGSGAELDQLLTPEVVARIHRDSGGLPEQVSALADGLLSRGARPPAAARGGKKRPVLLVAGVMLVAVAAGAVLLFQDHINRWFEAPRTSDTGAQQDGVAPLAEAPSLGGVVEPQAPQGESEPRLEDQSGSPVDLPLPEAGVAEPEISAGESESEPPGGVELGRVDEPALARPEPVVPEDGLAPTPESATAGAAAEPTQPQPEPEAKPAPTPAPAQTAPPEPSPEMAWLRAQPEGNYTLQLMALVDQGDVLDFVRRHGIAADSATFAITRRGRELTVLVYGSYPDRAAANRAAAELPRAWRVEPWIRSFASVRRDLPQE